MNVLALDTSSDSGSIVLCSSEGVLGEVRLANSLQHSERLFRSIDFLFEQIDLTLAEVDVFAAARGPGSFTGLRVGLAAVAGLAFARGRPSVGVSTLAAWAWQVGSSASMISPVLDARRGEIFAALYRRKGEELIELRAPTVLQPGQWLSALGKGPVVFCGTGLRALESVIEDRPDCEMRMVSPYLAGAVAQMARTPNREALAPLYVRPSTAEVNRTQ